MVYVLYQNLTTDSKPLIVSLATMTLGLAWYYLFIHPRRGERWTLPDLAAEDSDHPGPAAG